MFRESQCQLDIACNLANNFKLLLLFACNRNIELTGDRDALSTLTLSSFATSMPFTKTFVVSLPPAVIDVARLQVSTELVERSSS